MPRTKRGIYHNLKESKYTVSNTEIVFFFSSKFYMNKYLNEYKENREQFLARLIKQNEAIPLNLEILADLSLYRCIEKRGFRACIKGVDIGWEELHQYALRKMTNKNTLDWFEIQKPKLTELRRIME